MNEEVWADVPGFEGFYQVSSFGRVKAIERTVLVGIPGGGQYGRSQKERIRIPTPSSQGRLTVVLSAGGRRKTFDVHRLVAAAFVEGYHDRIDVHFKDGDKNNCRVDNLVLKTRADAVRSRAKLNEDKVREILRSNLSAAELAKIYGVFPTTIYKIRDGLMWKDVTPPP